MELRIEDPRDYILCRLNENQIINKVESTTELTVSDWLKLVSPDDPDIHEVKYIMQLQYKMPGKAPHFLMVDENGTVSVKGTSTDKRTFFDVVLNTITETYNILSRSDQERILYMDGTTLKSRIHDTNSLEESVDTIFCFKSRSPTEQKPPFEIISQSGTPLRFDKKGNYVYLSGRKKSSNDDPPCNFYVHRVERMYITNV